MQIEQTNKKAGVAIITSDKIDFKTTKAISTDKEGPYIILQGWIQ